MFKKPDPPLKDTSPNQHLAWDMDLGQGQHEAMTLEHSLPRKRMGRQAQSPGPVPQPQSQKTYSLSARCRQEAPECTTVADEKALSETTSCSWDTLSSCGSLEDYSNKHSDPDTSLQGMPAEAAKVGFPARSLTHIDYSLLTAFHTYSVSLAIDNCRSIRL